jgi:hypothetical protein
MGHFDSQFLYVVETEDGLAYEFPFDEVEEVDIRESGALVVTCYDEASSQAFAPAAWTRLYVLTTDGEELIPDTLRDGEEPS